MEENKDEEILNAQEEENSEATAEEAAPEEKETEDTVKETEAEETEESSEAEEAAEDSDKKSEELEKRYMSLYAEYDNYRKRTQKEKENLYADAVADVAKEFLAVIDNIDRAVETAKGADENSIDKVIEGIELLGRQAGDILTKIGVEEIKAERGEKFDPNFHEAVMHVEDEDLGEQEIAMVFTKGYMYKGKVIRHVVVQVAN
ncbi:MAG: nucleotide exchange factor GrpE [Oscillospiraceae bacterium]|nr:nucleotide exchange factor GrpE [Oscillospiraceae bacterium]